MSGIGYRPEIDGLRAFAVVPIILFHMGLSWVPSGYIGVDVFFVISGFLITSIIKKELDQGSFSFRDFWARRVRRILPAMILMTATTLAVTYAFVFRPDQQAIGKQGLAALLSVANIYLWRSTGDYWGTAAEESPFLHAWSLSVEEQFYLFFPVAMWLIFRLRSRWMPGFILIASVASLALFLWGSQDHPTATFYLLPTRVWELGTGCLMAVSLSKQQTKNSAFGVFASAGLGMVVASYLFINKPNGGLGLAVVGTALIIAFGQTGLCNKLLSQRLVVHIGRISYSLYLWHWPFVVFAREMSLELTLTWKIALLVASLLAGYFSWRWVEMPFRSGLLLATRRRSLIFGLTSAATLFVIAFSIKASGGFPSRLPVELRVIISDINWNGAEYTSAKSEVMPIGFQDDGPVDFVLWGDSHGASAAPAINAVATDLKLKGHAYLNNGTPPVTGLWFADMSEASAAEMVALNERVLAEIIDSKPVAVFLVGRWVARCEGYNDAEMVGEPDSIRFTTMLVDSMIPEPTFKEASSALARQIKAMGARLAVHRIKLVIFQQVPESNESRTASRFYSMKRFSGTSEVSQFTTTKDEFLKRQERTMKLLENQTTENVRVIDASSQFFFRDRDQLKVYAERSYYRDEDHLTRAGAMHYLEPAFKKFMSWIPREESK